MANTPSTPFPAASPDPVAAIAYASCTPPGIEPAMPSEALTSRAAYERLNRAAARAETLVLYRLDMLSGCRDSLDVDQERLERSIQNLWRLTAVRKTLLTLEASLNAPTSTPPPDDAILQQIAENIDKALAEEAELEAGDDEDDESTPAPEAGPSTPSKSVAVGGNPCSSASTEVNSFNQPSSHASHTSHSSHNPQSAIPNPQSSPALSIRAVPACPKLTPTSATRMLGRVNADLANYPGHTYTNADYNFAPPIGALPEASTRPEDSSIFENTNPLDDPALSDNLKSQISYLKSSPSSSPSPFGDFKSHGTNYNFSISSDPHPPG
jgi:hypothetical protein